MVFSIRAKRPESVVGRIWNLAQDACGIASVALVVLKLTGLVTWSWWWVLSPMWLGGFLLAVVLCALLVLVVLNLRERVVLNLRARSGASRRQLPAQSETLEY